uniref:Putative leucine aminopeptidase n=1 Tax=Hordeum vulgare subsp. vulgare TaxID=112509 RepID=Q8SA54_HORVV|nr:putative leucine aminopeptidase [Hordeum vulgare subsp. vulgare]
MGSGTWRKAYGALNDSTKVGLTNLTASTRNFGSLQDLDIAIVKATNHVECPPKERHFRTSVNPPHFIHLCYKPVGGNVKRKLAIVGKGLTFDSGGYNIKTGPGCSIGWTAEARRGDNTNAEGRLTLADALVYACNQGVDKIIDLATLTGACVVALGPSIAGIFTPSDELA